MVLVVEHHEDLEIDLLRQGFDLLDFWRGKITPRRMQLLISNLPATSRAFAKVNPEQAAEASWSAGEYLQAVAIDMFGVANFKGYEPITRPADAYRQRSKADRVAEFLAAQAERNKQREADSRRGAAAPSKRRG